MEMFGLFLWSGPDPRYSPPGAKYKKHSWKEDPHRKVAEGCGLLRKLLEWFNGQTSKEKVPMWAVKSRLEACHRASDNWGNMLRSSGSDSFNGGIVWHSPQRQIPLLADFAYPVR
jgi:hypothetical protein